MKKTLTTPLVILAVGLAMVLLGSVLKGITWGSGFSGAELAIAFNNIGYIVSVLSGVVLAAVGISCAIKGDADNKDEKENNKK